MVNHSPVVVDFSGTLLIKDEKLIMRHPPKDRTFCLT